MDSLHTYGDGLFKNTRLVESVELSNNRISGLREFFGETSLKLLAHCLSFIPPSASYGLVLDTTEFALGCCHYFLQSLAGLMIQETIFLLVLVKSYHMVCVGWNLQCIERDIPYPSAELLLH